MKPKRYSTESRKNNRNFRNLHQPQIFQNMASRWSTSEDSRPRTTLEEIDTEKFFKKLKKISLLKQQELFPEIPF